MFRTALAIAAAGLVIDDAGPAWAQTAVPGGTIAGSVTAASNYVSRGLSNSDNHPTLQGILEYTHASGVFLGTFASNVDFDDNDNATAEVDVWGGYGFSWRGLAVRADALWYYYPGVGRGMSDDFNTLELEIGAEYKLPGATLAAGLSYSPNYFFNSGDSLYYSFDVAVPVLSFLTLEGHVGHQDVQDNAIFGAPDYSDWQVGIAALWRGFKLGLYYVDTDLGRDECFAGKPWCRARALASLSYAF